MSFGLYRHRASRLHRLGAGWKLAALSAAGTGVAFIPDWRVLALLLPATAGLYALAGLPIWSGLAQLRPALWVLAPIVALQAVVADWRVGALVGLRFAVLILWAALVTLTTRQSDMVAALEALLGPLRRVGVDPARAGLAVALVIRFMPLIAEQAARVREAQRARGVDRNPLALAVPLVVHVLKMADDLAEAIDARSPDPDR